MGQKIYRITTVTTLALVLGTSNIWAKNPTEPEIPVGSSQINDTIFVVARDQAGNLVRPNLAAVGDGPAAPEDNQKSGRRFVAKVLEVGRNLIRSGSTKLRRGVCKLGKWFASMINRISNSAHKDSQLNLHNVSDQLCQIDGAYTHGS